MDQSEIDRIMLAAAAEALETMFFTGVESELPSEEGQAELGPGCWAVEVKFSGRPSGAFWLEVSPRTSRVLADSFLGALGDELPEERVRDVVFELANMLCGSILSHFGKDCTFLLEPPRLASPDGCVACRYVRVPEGVIGVRLRLEPAIENAKDDGLVVA